MISVIMLTYNRHGFVENMIGDILRQTYHDFEFIIVDNGSTDETSEILANYQSCDDRVRVLSLNSPVSIGKARNIGLNLSRGKYVAFVDDDDRVEEDFLEFLYNLIMEVNGDISMCGASQGNGITRVPQCLFDERFVLDGEEACRLLIGRKYIRNGTATKLYKREILERFPFVENYMNEDLHTQYKYLLASSVVVLHGVDKYYITRHTGNVSGFTSDASKWNYDIMKGYLDAYHNRTEYIRNNALSVYSLAQYSEWSFMISMIDKIEEFGLEDCLILEKIMKEELKEHESEFLSFPETRPFEMEWVRKYIRE